MNILWKEKAWLEYLYWQTQDKKTFKIENDAIEIYQCGTHYGE